MCIRYAYPAVVDWHMNILFQSPDSAYGSLLSEVKGPEGYIKSTSQPAYMRNVWISGQDCVTPPHYDLAENLLVQLEGEEQALCI